jgi:hypothetical protein
MALSPEQRQILRTIIKVGNNQGASTKQKLAAIETGLVESGLHNLPGGDADSAGWRQERASLYPNPTNVRAAARRFYREAKQFDKPGISAGDLAAMVQRPASQYRGRYGQRASDAEALLNNLGGGGNGGSTGSPRTRTTTTTTGLTPEAASAKQALVSQFLSQSPHTPSAHDVPRRDSSILDFASRCPFPERADADHQVGQDHGRWLCPFFVGWFGQPVRYRLRPLTPRPLQGIGGNNLWPELDTSRTASACG